MCTFMNGLDDPVFHEAEGWAQYLSSKTYLKNCIRLSSMPRKEVNGGVYVCVQKVVRLKDILLSCFKIQIY